MERPQKTPERSYELRDPKLPVIHGQAPHNRGEDHRNPKPISQIQIH